MLKEKFSPICLITIILLLFFWVSLAAPPTSARTRRFNPSTKRVEADLIEVLAGDENFTTLLQLLNAADMIKELRENDNITIFAPTNEAFRNLSRKKLEALLKPENRSSLIAILSYHIVPFRITWRDLPGNKLTLRTLFRSYPLVLIKSKEDPRVLLAVNDAPGLREIKAEFLRNAYEAHNGNVYTIDSVLIPWKVHWSKIK